MSEPIELAVQIASLRRSLFWSKSVVGFLILVLFSLVLGGLTRRPETVEANQILLKDKKGNLIAKLGDEGYGSTCLTLFAQVNGPRSELCVDRSGSFLVLSGPNDSRVSLTPGFSTIEPSMPIAPGLYIGENNGQNFASISIGSETSIAIGHGSMKAIEISSPTGSPAINLFGGDGKKLWSTH
jgi:hypothetical protein